jgi:hypothetical protein
MPVPVWLLDAEPAIAGLPGGEDRRRGVELRIRGDRERRDARAARSAGAVDRSVDALAKRGE